MKRGIAMTSRTPEGYRRIIALFRKNAMEKISGLVLIAEYDSAVKVIYGLINTDN
jgi:hypothetical protein